LVKRNRRNAAACADVVHDVSLMSMNSVAGCGVMHILDQVLFSSELKHVDGHLFPG
jgi:hypothetical protein